MWQSADIGKEVLHANAEDVTDFLFSLYLFIVDNIKE